MVDLWPGLPVGWTVSCSKCLLKWGVAVVMVALQTGCQTSVPSRPVMTEEEAKRSIPRGERILNRLAEDNRVLEKEFVALRDSGGWQKRGYFSAQESDRMELLLFRFHAGHHQLAGISERYEGVEGKQAQEVRLRAVALGKGQAEFLVRTFEEDQVAVEKLNQPYPRSEISRHTYDKLAGSLRNKVERELKALGRKIEDDIEELSYELQAEVFFGVSRLKKPSAYVVRFSDAQKREVRERLQPGDLVLTYTGGYASNIFIPGSFKHGMTYVGTPSERHAVGLSPERILATSGLPQERGLAENLWRATTSAGRPANLIEAVGEGVKFSNLDHIMDTHIWRMLVIRPCLDSPERIRQLGRTFSYLGEEYDFRFDFADASRQVCTEVIYRSLNGMHGIDFPLTRRGGHVTLSADDLVTYWLEDRPEAFEFVLYAEEAPLTPGHGARVLHGEAGKRYLEMLMKQGS